MAARIRVADESDAVRLAEIYRPFVERMHFTFEETPPSPAEIRRRIADPLHPWLVIEVEGRLAGYASAAPMRNRDAYRWSVETGIYIAAQSQRQGLGRQLVAAQLDLLQRQGFVTAIAGIALPNPASIALHESMGFTSVGIERGVGFKLGRWIDVGRWQRELAPRLPRPPEPVPHWLA